MQSSATTPEAYLAELPEERKEVMEKLRALINENLPNGFEEVMIYGMLGWVVPHTKYPAGYHCNPELPLPFLNLASQKNFIALYHSGIYADKKLHDWFVEQYPKYVSNKPDMGKSCIRFKNVSHIPFELIAELVAIMTPDEWISLYEKNVKG
jgi:uncharacterized protein YdhG (YjbR/CyaY superfamily)